MRPGTRYVFSQLARGLNRLAGLSKGKVFDDRYWRTDLPTPLDRADMRRTTAHIVSADPHSVVSSEP